MTERKSRSSSSSSGTIKNLHAENLFVDDGCYRQAIKAVSKRFPELDVIPSLAWFSQTQLQKKPHQADEEEENTHTHRRIRRFG